ncbi:MAG: histidine kinase [Deltaproteobacteria bacterium]|nr:histidine kinase [Deltaproteobacteria bacterium]
MRLTRSLPRVAGLAAAVLGVTSLLALQNWAAVRQIGRPVSWGRLWLAELPLWMSWAACVPFIVALVTRSGRWPVAVRVPVHFGAALACHVAVFSVVALTRGEASTPELRFAIVRSAGTALIIYGAIAAAVVAFDRSTQARRAAALSAALARARLDRLRAQLRPHFLFNTLNTAVALVRREPEAAAQVLLELSSLLRRCLVSNERGVSLAAELGFCRSYLRIQRRRFGPRLRVAWRIDPATADVEVPALCLQPLVENAVLHGLRPGRSLRIELRARIVDSDRLRLEIVDDGPGLDAHQRHEAQRALDGRAPSTSSGIGLRTTAARLRLHAGRSVRIRLLPTTAAGHGLRIVIDLPARRPQRPSP